MSLEPDPRWQAGTGSFGDCLRKKGVDFGNRNEAPRADFHRRQPILLDKL
jgi:hypothetical protein